MEVGEVGEQLLGAGVGHFQRENEESWSAWENMLHLGQVGRRGRERCVSESRRPPQCSKGSSLPEEGLLPGFYLSTPCLIRNCLIPCLHRPLPGCCLVPLTILPSPLCGINQIGFPNGGVVWTPGL